MSASNWKRKYLQYLRELKACDEAIKHATDSSAESFGEFWNGANLQHICAITYLVLDAKTVILAACDCARTALRNVEPGKDRALKAIESAEAWCAGGATIDDVRKARSVAMDYVYRAILDHAEQTIISATLSACCAASVDTLYGAVYAAAGNAAISCNQDESTMCDQLRRHFTAEMIWAAMESKFPEVKG